MMRAALLLLLSMLGAPAMAATLADADARFAKGLYQEALKGYEAVLSSGTPEDRPQALWRACESEALLFRYGTAYERLRAAKPPEDPKWRARFALLKAELGREYLKQYGDRQGGDVEEGAADAFRLTPEQLRAEVDASFRALWDAREALAQAPVAGESYILDVAKADAGRYPTLLDFVVLRWTEYLLEEEPDAEGARKPAAASFLKEAYDAKPDEKAPPGAQAGAVYEEAARLGGPGREAARELWRLRRALIPFEASGKVAPFDDWNAGASAAAGLFRRWRDAFKTPEGRAMAGFQAAELLNRRGSPDEAVSLCDAVAASEPGARGARLAAKLAAEIRLPSLSLGARVVPTPGDGALTLSVRNLGRVHLRLYKASPEEVSRLRPEREVQPWSSVLSVPTDELVRAFLGRPPEAAWTVPTPALKPYVAVSTTTGVPTPQPGLFLVLAAGDEAFQPGSSLMAAALVNVTDLVLLGNAGLEGLDRDFLERPEDPAARRTAPAFRFYAFDGKTGSAAARAALDVKVATQWRWTGTDRTTDELGRAELPATVALSPDSYQSWEADPLARRGQSLAYWGGSLSFGYSTPERLKVLVETDRPIYRPGQAVLWKVTVLERVPQGWRAFAGGKARVSFADANGQQVKLEAKALSALGSAAGEFAIPAGRLLGRWSLSASVSDGRRDHSGYVGVPVEEYKRPEFEVLVDESSGAWRYGRDVAVAGAARYYFGGPVPDAAVTYTVTRVVWRPWFCWWWSWRPEGGTAEVLRGAAKTDADGRFKFAFTPQPADLGDKDPLPARFVVKVEARDAGGRTLSAERTFTAGAKAALFRLDPQGGFAVAGTPFSVAARLVSLDETALSGKGRWRLFRLERDPADPPAAEEWGGDFPAPASLESLFTDVPDGKAAGSGKLAFTKEGGAKAALGDLAPGAYRLRVEAEDPWGGKAESDIVILAADKSKPFPLRLGAVTLPEHSERQPGQTANFLLGSSALEALTHVEIWGGSFLLERRALEGKGPRLVSVKLDARHKGGLTVRWFGVRDYRVRGGQAALSVPWKDKELKVALTGAKVLEPGKKSSWKLSVKDAKGKPASGEATLRMYDRSLEYYAKSEGTELAELYSARPQPLGGLGSQRSLSAREFEVTKGWVAQLMAVFRQAVAEPLAPGLRMNRSRVYRRRFGAMMMMKGVAREDSGDMAMEGAALAAPSPSGAPSAGGGRAAGEEAKSAAFVVPAQPPVKARTDFSETAFFKPQIPVKAGHGSAPFTAPERLTAWRVSGYALTKDGAYALAAAEAVTRKELMVRVEMPRFLREGDKAMLKAVVHNESDKPMSGSVTLGVVEDGKPAPERLGLTEPEQSFKVPPHGAAPFSWPVAAPEGTGSFTVTATARAGARADAESRDLPLLPARQRLVESVVVALSGDVKKTLTAAALKKDDPSRQDELLQLQVDPQLALTVLNAVPFLVQYPYECMEQTLNRWLPSAILSKVYAKHPALAKAAAKVPKRTTITPAWESDDPKRLMALMESPYVGVSKGIETSLPVVDMLDPAVVKRHEASALERLKAAQLPDGSFPWFPGGRPDLYMTLYVLAGFAEARHFGVDVPPDMARSALRCVMAELPRRMKPEEGEVAGLLYASYVVTSFPDDLKRIPELPKARELVKLWLAFCDKHADAMTRLGKAYASYAYRRLGDGKNAELYMDRAMDAARTDELTGVHWVPEKNSWLWYSDDLETHAFLIRALQTLRPGDPRLPGMVQWLLFNRKGSVWKSTKASAAAVYALLDFMAKSGALEKGDTFTVRWGGLSDASSVGPTDWLERPLRWTKTGQLTKDDAEAKVTKSGPGFAFASLTHVFSTTRFEEASEPGLLALNRRFFRRVKKGDSYRLEPLAKGDTVKVGDEVEVRLTVTSRGQLEYLHLKDPRGAGFEAEALRSGWAWDGLGRYEEPRDSLTNYFVSWMPQGEYKLTARIRPTTPGTYRVGPAVLQSMYAPEFAAHSAGFELKVEE